MKKISIHDYENSRVLILDLPKYVQNAVSKVDDLEDVATCIMTALGLSSGSCEWFDATKAEVIQCNVEDLTQDFKADFEEALADAME